VFGAGIELRSGEILGIAGVSGNGQTELVEALVGLRTLDSGTITYRGADVTHQTVRQRRDSGFAHIPEDRLVMGLNLRTNLDENVVVTSYQKPPYSSKGVFRFGKVRELAQQIIDAYQVRSARVGEPIRTLSGGNLQKIVLGRELKGDPKLIIANQPTRGLDVGSIEFVHKTLVEERDKGAAVLLISVELDEIMALSDRIIVMFAGKIVGEMTRADATEETLGLLMAGASRDPAELAEKAEA
jgi:simple sugar transport system ATP-binding protein